MAGDSTNQDAPVELGFMVSLASSPKFAQALRDAADQLAADGVSDTPVCGVLPLDTTLRCAADLIDRLFAEVDVEEVWQRHLREQAADEGVS